MHISSAGRWIVGHDIIVPDKSKFSRWNVQEYILDEKIDLDGLEGYAKLGLVVFTERGKPTLKHYVKPYVLRREAGKHWQDPINTSWDAVDCNVVEAAINAAANQKLSPQSFNSIPSATTMDDIGECFEQLTYAPVSRVSVDTVMYQTFWVVPIVMYSHSSEICLRFIYPSVKSIEEAFDLRNALRHYSSSVDYLQSASLTTSIGYKLKRIEEYRNKIKECEDENTTICEAAADALNELSDKYGIEIAV